MKKINKKTLVLTSVIILLPVMIGIFLWSKLPETIPTHFGLDGTPDGWSSKAFAVFGIPFLMLGLHLLCLFGTAQDPKYDNISEKIYALVVWICPVVSLLVMISCYGSALGWEMNITRYIMMGMGIIVMVMGNYLPKCRQNYTMGYKLPWTLDDEENWNKTHRLAGFLMVAGGILIIINAFLQWVWLFFVIIMAEILVPTVYSFLYYKKNKKI